MIHARRICQKITYVVLEKALNNHEHIPCQKGCSACCSHYLVPLSVPEAFRLKQDISNLPADMRKSMWEKNLEVARKILESKPPELFFQQFEKLENSQMILRSLSNWYSNLNLACPFLCDELCSIYELRPLACREHFVKDTVKTCSGGHAAEQAIDIPIQMPVVLGKLAGEFEQTDTQAIILPLAVIWAGDNQSRAERTWPTEILIRRFAEIIHETADSHSKSLIGKPEAVMST